MHKIKSPWIYIFVLILFGCSSSSDEFTYAPVYAPSAANYVAPKRVALRPRAIKPIPRNTHVVVKGDTLYSIAWRYNLDYRKLARMNAIHAPYALSVGQRLLLALPANTDYSTYHNAKSKQVKKIKRVAKRHRKPIIITKQDKARWSWPLHGRVNNKFKPQKGQKGINIVGHRGQKIRAARSGRIAYASNGLRGYGNMIIIKHNKEFLSAYAHNAKMYVREGQYVKKGQIIGEVGARIRGHYQLHFEIRRAGIPVNPLKYLS